MHIQRFDISDNETMRPFTFGTWVSYKDAFRWKNHNWFMGFSVGFSSCVIGLIFGKIF